MHWELGIDAICGAMRRFAESFPHIGDYFFFIKNKNNKYCIYSIRTHVLLFLLRIFSFLLTHKLNFYYYLHATIACNLLYDQAATQQAKLVVVLIVSRYGCNGNDSTYSCNCNCNCFSLLICIERKSDLATRSQCILSG